MGTSASIDGSTTLAQQTEIKKRIASIDVLRGIVMVIMLMDHVRERIYLHMQVSDPMDVSTTSPELFFTRLAAHLCAPVFVFLTGLSAWLYSHPANGKTRSATDFLLKRGLFLVFIEVAVINFAWMGEYHTLWLQVMWAIGLSMITLAFMVKLPFRVIGAIGFIIVFGHNLLTPITFAPNEFGYSLWTILHDRNFLVAEGPIKVKISYPVLPWIGVIALGYFAGPIYASSYSGERRKSQLIQLALACLTLLLVIRGFNIYGETLPWQMYDSTIMSVMSFLNYTKYPPSLDFLLLTLGIAFLLLVWLEPRKNKLLDALEVYGSAPMFFYILHLYALLVIYQILIAIFGANQGSLYGVDDFYWVWIGTVTLAIVLYFPTKRFAKFKHTSSNPLWRYL